MQITDDDIDVFLLQELNCFGAEAASSTRCKAGGGSEERATY
jgi:hypothetical protein